LAPAAPPVGSGFRPAIPVGVLRLILLALATADGAEDRCSCPPISAHPIPALNHLPLNMLS
jgi:hypothetical protein